MTGHQDKAVRLWDLRKGQKLAESRTTHDAAVTSVAFSPASGAPPVVLTASRDNKLRVLDGFTLLETAQLSCV